MQSVTKLVEDGVQLIKTQQRSGAIRWARNTHDVDNHRAGLKKVRLLHKGRHPCATTLGWATKVVREEKADAGIRLLLLAVIEDFPHAHALGITLQIITRNNRDAVETMGGGEDTIEKHCVQREILAQLIRIQGESALAHLVFPIRPVSRAKALAIKLCFFGQNLVLAGRLGINRWDQAAQHVTYRRSFLSG